MHRVDFVPSRRVLAITLPTGTTKAKTMIDFFWPVRIQSPETQWVVYEARRAQGFIILECQSYLNYYLILRFIFTHFFPSLKENSWDFFCLFSPNLILFFMTSKKLELSVNWHCHSLFPLQIIPQYYSQMFPLVPRTLPLILLY